ncbi:MAG: response regulator transcription factor [Betaproteobacteria bacterium]|nr:response regulator transcription factor [Betaproteobacteria bacterium]
MKILIADTHRFVAEATRTRLSEIARDAEFVFATNAHELSTLADDTLDLAIVELEMPDADGCSHVDELFRHHPMLPVIVFSGSNDSRLARDMLERGAAGFIPKAYSGDVMLSAVRLVLAGGIYVPPLILSALTTGVDAQARAPSGNPAGQESPPSPRDPVTSHSEGASTRENLRNVLTERQVEVLELLSQGKPNKLIARALGINEGTVKIHLAAIFRALNVSNRTEAVIKARSL